MDTQEQAKAKRDHGCEHLEDGVKRAKRMEHHEDDDGDVVCWADESDELEFRDNLTGRPLDPVRVRKRRVYVEADVEECIR